MTRLRRVFVLLGLALVPLPALRAAEPEPKPADKPPRYEFRKGPAPDGMGKFCGGRELAGDMGPLPAGWLDRPEREKEEEPAKLMEALKIQPGDVAADIGAGSGYFTFRLRDKVGPRGKVL